MLAHLLLARSRVVTRDQLIDELWGEAPPPTASDSLNVHAGLLRRALGPRLCTVPSGYVLEVSPQEVDANRFESQVQAVMRGPGDRAASANALSAALSLWRGPVYGGIAVGPTAAAAGARLDELRLNALEERVEADLSLGRHAALVPELTGLLASRPTRERMAGQLMLALHRCDRSADALEVFAATSRILDDRLGVDPGDALTLLSRAIFRGDPTLAAPGPALLPSPPSRFIGRRQELARAAELLATSRLLTLSGVGGCGKTRLGLELARLAAPGQPGGVHFADLGPLGPEASVGRQVAAVLGVRERRGSPLPAQLAARFLQRRALLFLDNCEHLVEGCAELTSYLLANAPGLRVLVTSREPLGIAGEVVFTVPGLEVPSPAGLSAQVEATDAVRLLVDRAMAVRPGFMLGRGDAEVAAVLCRRLDGLPLAIELAAARLRTLSLREVAERVAERVDAVGGSRSVDARHRTMRACMEWSHETLDEFEKIALRRLSVFAGEFSPEAGAAVIGGWAPMPTGADMLDVCRRLADKSMLAVNGEGGRTGYRMLEVVRQFSAERLTAAEEEAAARARHAAWYREFVPDARAWAGPDQPKWMNRLRRELENVHAALAWFLGDGWEPDRALEMVGPMWSFWYMAGRVGEGRTWLSRVLAASPSEPTAARALAVRGAAALARITGEFSEAIRLGEESLHLCRAMKDERGIAAALNNLCITAMMSGDLTSARRHGEEGRVIIEHLGDAQGIATAHNNLGLVARIVGDLDHALHLFDTALLNYRLARDGRGTAAALSNLAIVGRRRGDTERARSLAVEALRLYTELGFDEGQIDCLEAIAAIAAATGDAGQALRLLTVTSHLREDLGSPLFLPDELAQVADALEMAYATLTPIDAENITAASRMLSLPSVVAAILLPGPEAVPA